MSDSPTAPEIETPAALPPPAPARKTERRGGASFALICMVLIALAAAGWAGWRQLELQKELDALRADMAALQKSSASSSNQFAEVQQRQQELDAALQETSQQTLEQTQQELAASRAEVSAQAEQLNAVRQQLATVNQQIAAVEQQVAAAQLQASERQTGGAPLAEAEMLLRFAQQRLQLARDTATAVDLYLAADEVLRTVDDPAVFRVRETLARELAALQATGGVDVPGLFARLGELAARVDNFNVVAEGSVQDFSVTPTAADDDAPAPGWWNSMKQTLGEYFVVTQSTADIVPQLNAAEQFQLRALVQLHIEQARLALLRAEPQVYQRALDDAIATARRWLRGDAGSLEDFVASLESARDAPIVVELPALDETLSALRQLSNLGTPAPLAPPVAVDSRP